MNPQEASRSERDEWIKVACALLWEEWVGAGPWFHRVDASNRAPTSVPDSEPGALTPRRGRTPGPAGRAPGGR